MIQGWTKGVGDDFHCIITRPQGAGAKNNAWNGPVRNSTGIDVKADSASAVKVTLADMPVEIRAQLGGYETLFRSLFT
jgi:hypothetical protein